VRLDVEAEGGHSSMPKKDSAIGILSKAITKIEQNPMPPYIEGTIILIQKAI
jgi:carboxypeptidase PM20D1